MATRADETLMEDVKFIRGGICCFFSVTHSESQPVGASQWLTHLHTLAAGQTDRKEGSTDREATLKASLERKRETASF